VIAGGVAHRGARDHLVRGQAGAIAAGGADADREHAEQADHDHHEDRQRAAGRPARQDLRVGNAVRRLLRLRGAPEGREHRFQPGIGRLQRLLDLVENLLLAAGQDHLVVQLCAGGDLVLEG
jgi:hypothetical protein